MKYFIYTIILIVAASVVGGFFVIGSPKQERERRFDDQKIQQLQSIQWQIGDFYRAKERLPQSLYELNDSFRGSSVPQDPQTGSSYGYQTQTKDSFILCAVFNLPAISKSTYPAKPYPADMFVGEGHWGHGDGKTCFERTIDRDFFFPKDMGMPKAETHTR